MSYKEDFHLFVGGKSGILKGVKIEKSTCLVKNLRNLASNNSDYEITSLAWGDEDEKIILAACQSKKDSSIQVYNSDNGSVTNSFTCVENEAIKGLSYYNEKILTAANSGRVSLWGCDGVEEVVIEAGSDLCRMRHCNIDRDIIATGGTENKLKLFNLETKVKIFEEKNVRHDWLELKVPLWISDIGFLQDSSQIATCSRYGHIRLYDRKAQRRPVINLEIKDHPLTTLATTYKEKHIVVGSGKGVMNLIDLRSPGKILNTYKDFAGSVTAINCMKDKPYIFSVSLDRYLRVHHVDTKRLLYKTYLTSRLRSMVLRSDVSFDVDDSIGASQKVVISVKSTDTIGSVEKDAESNDRDEVVKKKVQPCRKINTKCLVETNNEEMLPSKRKKKKIQ